MCSAKYWYFVAPMIRLFACEFNNFCEHLLIILGKMGPKNIPRVSPENWLYPSERQFFRAGARKGHQLDPGDMHSVVAIHNAVNEKAWVRR